MITYASYLGEDRNLAADAGIIIALDTLVAVVVFVVFPILFSGRDRTGHGRSRRDFREPHRGVRRYPWWSDPRRRFLRDGRNCRALVGDQHLGDARLVPDRRARRLSGTGIGRARDRAVFLLGVPVTIDLMFLNLYDLLADGILLVLGSLLLALFVGWVIPDVARDELRKGIADIGGLDDAWIWAVRIPIVIVVLVSLYLGIVDYVDFLTGDFADWLAAR